MRVRHSICRHIVNWMGMLSLFAAVGMPSGNVSANNNRWISYLDPSLISEIVILDDLFYIATNGGILIYDPLDSSFQQLTSADGLPSNFLTACTFDNSGDLYAATDDAGIARVQFHANGIHVTTLSSTFYDLADDHVTTVAAWGDTIMYGTQNGAGTIVGGFPGTKFFKRDGLPSNNISDIMADGDRVWIATDSGIVTLNRLGFITDFSAGLPSLDVNVIERADGNVWVGMSNGVARFNPQDSSWVSLLDLPDRQVFSLHWDGSFLWAGTNNRLYYSSDGVFWPYVSTFQILVDYSMSSSYAQIRSVIRAPDGNWYMGLSDPISNRRGANLLKYNGASFDVIRPNTVANNWILRMDFDTDGSLWVSTASFGVGKLTLDEGWINYNSTTPGGLGLSHIYFNLALLADGGGSKWFAVPDSAHPLDELRDQMDGDFANDEWSYHRIDSGGGDKLGSVQFLRAREDPAGNRWFLADKYPVEENSGIYILSADKSEWLRVTSATTGGDMWGGKIFDVAFGPGGVVYVANGGGGVQRWFAGGYDWGSLSDFTGDSWSPVGEVGVEFNSEAEIYILALRGDNTLGVGTSAGLYKFKGGALKHIQAKRGFSPGLLGESVLDLVFDREGNLWVATNLGLNRIAADDDNDIASYTTPAAWQNELNPFFDQSVVSPLVNAFCESIALHPTKDILFIGTKGGLSAFDFTPAQAEETDLSSIYLYPNPLEGRKGHSELKIGNITMPVLVEIYTLEGELVHSQEVADPSEPVAWDLTTAEGFLVASGVYLVRVVSNGRSTVRSVSVIR
ncbi:MAG: two-component regulator propeller domain-containing protein [Candidatus Latescibacterota bacterium]